MLKPADMQGFRAVVPRSARDEVLSRLHEVGVAQFKEISMDEVENEQMKEEFYEINSVLGRMEEVQSFFETSEMDTELDLEDESVEYVLDSSRELLEEIEPRKDKLDSKLQEIQEERDKLSAQTDILSKLSGVDLPMKYLQSTENVEIVVGQISEDELDEFMGEIEDSLSDEVFAASFGKGKTRIVILVCRKEVVSELSPIQYKFGIESLDLPVSDKTPEEFLEDLDEKLEEYEEEEKQIQEKVEEVREEKAEKINALTEVLEFEQERYECLSLFGRTDSTTVIEGWTPEKEIEKAEEAISETTEGAYIVRTYEPSEGEIEETPVKLENPGGFDSFEYITEMYGLPQYDATDPTIMVAISFSIFFAFTLSDAGYGLLILVAFLAGISYMKNMFSERLRKILIAGSICTIVIGALFGSWFGEWLGENIKILDIYIFGPRWVNPVDNPIPLLKLVIFVGIIQLLLGYGIGSVRKHIIRQNWRELILNDLGNVLFTLGLFLLIFCTVGTTSGNGIGLLEFGINYYFPGVESIFNVFIPFSTGVFTITIFQVLFYSGLILKIIGGVTQPDAGGMERVGGVVNTFYAVVDLISNAVSYTRLLALGVATSVIAFVVNFVGSMIFDVIYQGPLAGPISYVTGAIGILVLGIILAGGHAFNLFINSITGFVHTMRLHYAEFFQTFYEAGGKEYNPLRLIRKYTKDAVG